MNLKILAVAFLALFLVSNASAYLNYTDDVAVDGYFKVYWDGADSIPREAWFHKSGGFGLKHLYYSGTTYTHTTPLYLPHYYRNPACTSSVTWTAYDTNYVVSTYTPDSQLTITVTYIDSANTSRTDAITFANADNGIRFQSTISADVISAISCFDVGYTNNVGFPSTSTSYYAFDNGTIVGGTFGFAAESNMHWAAGVGTKTMGFVRNTATTESEAYAAASESYQRVSAVDDFNTTWFPAGTTYNFDYSLYFDNVSNYSGIDAYAPSAGAPVASSTSGYTYNLTQIKENKLTVSIDELANQTCYTNSQCTRTFYLKYYDSVAATWTYVNASSLNGYCGVSIPSNATNTLMWNMSYDAPYTIYDTDLGGYVTNNVMQITFRPLAKGNFTYYVFCHGIPNAVINNQFLDSVYSGQGLYGGSIDAFNAPSLQVAGSAPNLWAETTIGTIANSSAPIYDGQSFYVIARYGGIVTNISTPFGNITTGGSYADGTCYAYYNSYSAQSIGNISSGATAYYPIGDSLYTTVPQQMAYVANDGGYYITAWPYTASYFYGGGFGGEYWLVTNSSQSGNKPKVICYRNNAATSYTIQDYVEGYANNYAVLPNTTAACAVNLSFTNVQPVAVKSTQLKVTAETNVVSMLQINGTATDGSFFDYRSAVDGQKLPAKTHVVYIDVPSGGFTGNITLYACDYFCGTSCATQQITGATLKHTCEETVLSQSVLLDAGESVCVRSGSTSYSAKCNAKGEFTTRKCNRCMTSTGTCAEENASNGDWISPVVNLIMYNWWAALFLIIACILIFKPKHIVHE